MKNIQISCEYLFATKQGLPLKQDTFRTALNDLAVEEEIVDRQGKVFSAFLSDIQLELK